MSTNKRGFFRNAYDAMIEARQRQASQYVSGALLMLDDETLRARGLTRSEVRRSGYRSFM